MEIREQRPDGMLETDYVYCAWQRDGHVNPFRTTGVVKAANRDEAARRAAEELVGQLGLTDATIQVQVAKIGELTGYTFETDLKIEVVGG